nr:NAD(P)-dependent glycerol-1-phosphate dehydrogenase [Candidatus Njordarchaeota archaeon]
MFSVHQIQLPRHIVIGRDVLDSTGTTFRELGLSGPAEIVADETTMRVAGGRVKDSLEDEKYEVAVLLIEAADIETVNEARTEIRGNGASFVLGIGGGRSIDVAKLSSFNEHIPFVSVPTAASHDGVASPQASVKGIDKPHSMKAHAPLAVIADVGVIAQAPDELLVAGCGDAIANWTAVKDWKLSYKLRNEYYGEYAASIAKLSAAVILRNKLLIRDRTESGLRVVLEALISSGISMCIAGSSRPASGSEHMFSHALDQIAPKPALHGMQCGVGTIMMEYLHGGNWMNIKQSLKTIGAPTTGAELGISGETIVEALQKAHTTRPERYTILGEKGLTEEAARRLATVTGVI